MNPALPRRIRGELRLYARPIVVLLTAVYAVVVIGLLLTSQAFARDQVAYGLEQTSSTCDELAALGVPRSRCAATQASDAESNRAMAQIAQDVGPPGLAATRPSGIVAFTLGHAATAVGLSFLCLAGALVLGGERVALGESREVSLLRGAAGLVRTMGLVTVWALATAAAAAAALAVNRVAGIAPTWPGSVDHRSGLRFLAMRGLGATSVATIVAALLVALRTWLTNRAQWLVAGAALSCALMLVAAIGPAAVPPSNAAWRALDLGRAPYSYIDRLPFGLTAASPTAIDASIAVAAALGCTLLAARARPGGHVPRHGGPERWPGRAPGRRCAPWAHPRRSSPGPTPPGPCWSRSCSSGPPRRESRSRAEGWPSDRAPPTWSSCTRHPSWWLEGQWPSRSGGPPA